MNETPSIHDHHLISYTVNEETKEIILETVYREGGPVLERTTVVFSGVLSYRFRDHALPRGTTLNSIEEVEPMTLFEQDWNDFAEERSFFWADLWCQSKDKAAAYFSANKIRGFDISSSIGLCGWVLAQKMEISVAAPEGD
jgi:hypothetical protein